MESSDILNRIEQLMRIDASVSSEFAQKFGELSQGTVSLLALVYGKQSPQLAAYNNQIKGTIDNSTHGSRVRSQSEVLKVSLGILRNLKQEIEGGLTGSLRHEITGEILTDFIQLARTVLNEHGDKAKNVAAVLAAAAFEDAIRRMGESSAGVIGKEDLSDVLNKLKEAGVIKSPQLGIAQSYLSFRNHALHANWDKIEKESVTSVLGFVEELLLKHFN
jgi:hypothetical protein